LDTTELEQRLTEQRWTSHNVSLGHGLSTIPGREDFLTQDLRLRAIERSLRALVGPDLTGRSVLDLGSLEGGFALALALRGANVTAIEARSANVAKIRLLRDHFGLGNLEIIEGDVKEISVERLGRFDIVLALGILYHLDDPVPWLRQLGQLTSSVLILDTHIAPADDTAMDLLRTDLRRLGRLQLHVSGGEGFEGRWFNEFSSTITEEGRADQLWASWSNDRSFWLTEEALLSALRSAQFDLMYEQHDLTGDGYRTFKTEFPRVMYVCVRNGPAAEDGR
jgi:2-polyprenyl-3-methyl-5-hydroxy-6-metoxy-1,4-benzoquinol methylase